MFNGAKTYECIRRTKNKNIIIGPIEYNRNRQ